MCACCELFAQCAQDDVALNHAALVMVAVFDTVGRVSENEVIVLNRHLFEPLRIVENIGFDFGVTVNGRAGQLSEVHPTAEQMQHLLLIRKECFDAAQIGGRIATIIAALDR